MVKRKGEKSESQKKEKKRREIFLKGKRKIPQGGERQMSHKQSERQRRKKGRKVR